MKGLILGMAMLLCLAVPSRAEELTISAAASLTNAFTELAAAFEARRPDSDTVLNFASSGALYRQIRQGAPVDVYASANPKWMDDAEADGLIIPGTRTDFAANSLVLIVPADNPAGLESVVDLAEKARNVALGTPETVPAGQYAKKSLESLGLFDDLSALLIYAEHVRQVLDYVRRGEVDAGFVYRTDAIQAGESVRITQEMPLATPVTYPVAVLADAPNPELARVFVDFLATPGAVAILEKHGFSKPK
jgi:molybdate transport system substrate-binding protein